MNCTRLLSVGATIALGLFSLSASRCDADVLTQTNLVSDVPGMAATTDPNLKNPWGVAFSPISPFWVSNQATGTATLYDGAGNVAPLVVTIPGNSTPASGPTGQVFTSINAFALPNGSPARFIFDTLDGTIAGWNGGTAAVQAVSTPGAVYTGLALASSGGSVYLYAADNTGSVRVFDSNFKPVTLSGSFTDPNPLAGFAPFNVQLIGSTLYVTYARVTPQGTPLPGGYIDTFSTNGTFLTRFATGGPLQAPWGVALAPSGFFTYAGDILVGNFGNGEILAYSPSGSYVGTLAGANGQPFVNDFLWALEFRTGGANTNADALYFTAGINNQTDGLFGAIMPTPEPSSILLVCAGLFGLALLRRTHTLRRVFRGRERT